MDTLSLNGNVTKCCKQCCFSLMGHVSHLSLLPTLILFPTRHLSYLHCLRTVSTNPLSKRPALLLQLLVLAQLNPILGHHSQAIPI